MLICKFLYDVILYYIKKGDFMLENNNEIFNVNGLFGIRNKSNGEVICEPKFEFIKKVDDINITMITFENIVQMYIFMCGYCVIVIDGNTAIVNGNLYPVNESVDICFAAVDSYLSEKKENMNAEDVKKLKVDLVNKYNNALEQLKIKLYQIENSDTHIIRK